MRADIFHSEVKFMQHVRTPLGRNARKIVARKRAQIEEKFQEEFGLPSGALAIQNPRSLFRREQESWLNPELLLLEGLKLARAFDIRLPKEELWVLGRLKQKLHVVSENPNEVPREKYLRTALDGLKRVVKYGAKKMGVDEQYAFDILTKLERALESISAP